MHHRWVLNQMRVRYFFSLARAVFRLSSNNFPVGTMESHQIHWGVTIWCLIQQLCAFTGGDITHGGKTIDNMCCFFGLNVLKPYLTSKSHLITVVFGQIIVQKGLWLPAMERPIDVACVVKELRFRVQLLYVKMLRRLSSIHWNELPHYFRVIDCGIGKNFRSPNRWHTQTWTIHRNHRIREANQLVFFPDMAKISFCGLSGVKTRIVTDFRNLPSAGTYGQSGGAGEVFPPFECNSSDGSKRVIRFLSRYRVR